MRSSKTRSSHVSIWEETFRIFLVWVSGVHTDDSILRVGVWQGHVPKCDGTRQDKGCCLSAQGLPWDGTCTNVEVSDLSSIFVICPLCNENAMTIVIQRNSQRFLIVFQLNCCGKGQGTAFLTHITDTLGLTELCPSSGTYFVSVKMQQILLHEPQTLLLQEKPNFSSVNNSIFAAQTWRHRHRCHGIVQAGVILVVEVELELKGHTLLRPAQVESPFSCCSGNTSHVSLTNVATKFQNFVLSEIPVWFVSPTHLWVFIVVGIELLESPTPPNHPTLLLLGHENAFLLFTRRSCRVQTSRSFQSVYFSL